MRKVSVMLMVGLLVSCAGASFAAWAYQWEANEYPESFQSGSVFNYYQWHSSNRSITDDGTGNNVYVVNDPEPDPSNPTVKANGKFWTKEGIWDANQNGTIQFRLKIDGPDGNGGTLRFMIISDQSKTSATHYCNTFYFHTNKVRGYGFSDYSLDTTVWRTYKAEYNATTKHATLYYKDGSNWVMIGEGNNSDYEYITYPAFKFGQGSNSISGKYEMDYIYWTPEPATIGLLGLGALGFIRRR